MDIVDKGVLPASFMDFSLPSEFAREALFYLDLFGHFFCTSDYHVSRNYFKPFLLLYVVDGSFYAKNKGFDVTAQKNDILLLNCRQPHSYGCKTKGEFLYFHFDGRGSEAYVNHLIEKYGILFPGSRSLSLYPIFNSIITEGRHPASNVTLISHRIDRILYALSSAAGNSQITASPLTPAIELITKNYDQELTVETLASACRISPPQFYRNFKKYMDCSPHEYLLLYRLKQAKNLLLTTNDSIDVIAKRCGFNSHSHFTRAFKKSQHMTPAEFRAFEF